MNFDLGVYTNRGQIGLTYVQLAKLAFAILKADKRYSSCITSARIPGMEAYNKAGTSMKVGTVMGKVIGIGWESSTRGIIEFDSCPVKSMTIIEKDELANILCNFPLKKPANEEKLTWHSGPYYAGVIRPKKTGMIRKEVVGLRIDSTTKKPILCFEKIANDQKLQNDLLAVHKLGLTGEFNYAGAEDAFIEFGVQENKEEGFHGWVEAIVRRARPHDFVMNRFNEIVQHVTLLLNSVFEIARCINAEYETI